MNERQSRKRRCSLRDANFRLPEDITKLLREVVSNLTSNPRNNYLREQCFSKFVSKDTAPADVRVRRAVDKWLWTERENEATNDRLLTTDGDYNILPRVKFADFVRFAQELIVSIVGEIPAWDHSLFVAVDRNPNDFIGIFSGGASTSRGRTKSHPALKYLGKADATSSAKGIFLDLLEDMPGWAGHRGLDDEIVEVPGNVMFTVPKNTDIDRCACKEPDINMFLQKGLGGAIRRGLRRHGIDLNDQSRNRDLAREGSITGLLATLDLSSASDSVCTSLVQLLMPPVWYGYLADTRSPVTNVFGEIHRNEMFSSMGNGFTFELESLLFYALARTTAYFCGSRGVISVYGDDIIVPTTMALDLMDVLAYFGFKVNPEKSFWEGPFRESCGGHYYSGTDITPFYVKEPITDLVGLIKAANQLRKWANSSPLWCDEEVWALWSSLRDMVPKQFWGGRDLSSTESLVTPHEPRKRLTKVTKRRGNGLGGYILWLNATCTRSNASEAVVTSFRTEDRGLYRVRPAQPPYLLMTSSFFEEEWRTEFAA